MNRARIISVAAALAFSPALAGMATAQSNASATLADAWTWRATVYGWFPDARATSNFTLPGGDTISVDTKPDRYLSNLQFAFMGTLEARKGPWSFVGDAVYVDFGKANSNLTSIKGPSGTIPLPTAANVNLDLKGFVGTLEAGYSLQQTPTNNVDFVAGARYLALKTRLDWQFAVPIQGLPPQGSVERTKDIWDVVAGVRGKSEFADHWYVPYYADIGTGSSRVTWQAFAGLGYHFDWGDVTVGYRYLAYDFRGDRPVSNLAFGGPLVGIGVTF